MPNATQASVLGGAAMPGGVTMDLSGAIDWRHILTAEQIPESGVPVATGDPPCGSRIIRAFALSTSTLSTAPQIWTVDYTGLPT